MGAVTFSIDPELIQTLQNNLNLDIFIETGTFKGDALDIVKNNFKQIYSIELSQEYYQRAAERFAEYSHITILQGDSGKALGNFVSKIKNQAAVFWLDAHWCVANSTAGELSQCPLLAELNAIGNLHSDSVIIIDDARLFLATPPIPHEITQWPSFTDIIKALTHLSQSHCIMIINDCVVFYPNKIDKVVHLFAHQHGINWLSVLDKSRDYDKLLQQLIEKETEIKQLKNACDLREALLNSSKKTNKDPLYKELYDSLIPKMKETEENVKNLVKLKELKQEECDILKFRLTENEKMMQKLKTSNTSRELSFLADINKHFLEIYTRFEDLQKNIINDHRKNLSLIHKKYELIRNEKIKLIEPIKEGLIKKFDDRSLIEKIIHRYKRFLSPKLGELNLYSARLLDIPPHYSKIRGEDNPPTISIVTPSYNHGSFIERTIKSVLGQKYPNLEYIIQDGNSTDETLEIIQRYKNSLKHFETTKDSGQSQAINMGFRHATGEIMAYLNSDDLLLPGTLHYVGNYFANHPEVDVVYSHRILIDENDFEIGRWILPNHDPEILSWADYVPQETLFWRRNIWEKVGGNIDESFQFAMDWDLILRFKEANAKFVRLPRFLGAFRIHPHQKTSSEISMTGIEEMQRLRERCHGRNISFAEVAEATRSYLNRHLLYHRLYQAGILRY